MHDYHCTHHTTRRDMRRCGDISTWREALAFLLIGAAIAIAIALVVMP